MNTAILMWNPAISSYTMPRFKEAIGYYAEQLAAAIPEFTWTSGHSGQVLSEDVANRLETLWFD